MHIAYVEDNLTNVLLVQRIAKMNGHTVTPYAEGEIALKELMIQKFDLILMDVELAGEVNGLQVVQMLRSRGLVTPIVAVTAYAMMGDREKCLEAGCTDYLPKPLPIAEFLTLLAHYESTLNAPQTTKAEPDQITVVMVPPVTVESPVVTNLPVVSITEPHTDPVSANEQAMAVRGDTAPLPELSALPPIVKPDVEPPGVPESVPVATDAKIDTMETSPKSESPNVNPDMLIVEKPIETKQVETAEAAPSPNSSKPVAL